MFLQPEAQDDWMGKLYFIIYMYISKNQFAIVKITTVNQSWKDPDVYKNEN